MTDAEQRRHGTFWFADGNIVLQAEQTLFKVHLDFLSQESAYFQGMFALPRAANACDGTEEQPHLLLEEVAADTLANILTMMYTICGLEPSFDVEQLVDMLCVCDRLRFGNISTVVHRKLHPLLGPQRRLRLALGDHGVDHWGLPAFRELVCDFDTHVEVTAPPLLTHALWNVVYATRVKIIQTRMTKAIEIATFDSRFANKLCSRHHKAVYSAINSGGPHWEVVARLDDLNVERLRAHDPNCTVAKGFPRNWPAMFGEEEGWMLGAWNTYQSQSSL